MTLQRKTPMKRDGAGARAFANQRSELARTGGLKSRSAKRKKIMADDRVPYIKALIEAGIGCEVCPVLASVGIETRCNGRIEGLHERRKRSSGGSLTTRANLVPSCNWGNGFLEDEPKLIRDRLGDALVVREGDPEWAMLGAREDS